MLIWGAVLTMDTYLGPFLKRLTHADVTLLSALLLILGVAGFLGAWAAGRFIKGQVAHLLRPPALVMGDATLGLLLFGRSPNHR